jgi:Aldo/keto reductase family
VSPHPLAARSSRKRVLSAIDASLKRLGTDYVDLYQVHHYDAATPLDETLEAFDAVVRSGKARYVGCSNYPAWRVARALGRSETLHLARFVSVQHATTCCFARSSANCSRSVKRKGLRSFHTIRSPEGCLPESTRALRRRPRAHALRLVPPPSGSLLETSVPAPSPYLGLMSVEENPISFSRNSGHTLVVRRQVGVCAKALFLYRRCE